MIIHRETRYFQGLIHSDFSFSIYQHSLKCALSPVNFGKIPFLRYCFLLQFLCLKYESRLPTLLLVVCLVSKALAWGPRAHKQNVYRKFGLDPAIEYPPCEGVWGVSEVRAPLQDEIVDRFQIQSELGGSYASPLATIETPYTLEYRALMENYQQISESGGNYYYFKFKIKSTHEPLLLEYGKAIPWFDKKRHD
ncbi:hypothetical protein CNR22_12050 [Sphingobacteriaceae bacterium]|nr:hypothetical protein CNR22_12050 [Sphingobacteriaceae bacterium]